MLRPRNVTENQGKCDALQMCSGMCIDSSGSAFYKTSASDVIHITGHGVRSVDGGSYEKDRCTGKETITGSPQAQTGVGKPWALTSSATLYLKRATHCTKKN